MRMKLIPFILALLMAMTISLALPTAVPANPVADMPEGLPSLDNEMFSFRNGHRHHRHHHHKSCNKSPKICHAKGSPGRSCCRNQCVDLMTDSLNCGRCGRKCRFGETCCGGRCVAVMNDNWNCGDCNNKCSNGSYCKLGMCGYA